VNEKGIELKVGILVLVALALFGWFVMVLGDFRGGERRELKVDFETSADLKEGAPVKVSGVTIGKVARVDFWGGKLDEVTNRRVNVRVVLDLDDSMADAIRSDASAFISTLGFLGEKYVEIDPGEPESAPLAKGTVLVGEQPLRLELVARDVSAALKQVSEILSENRGRVASILTNLDTLLINANSLIVENKAAVAKLLETADKTLSRLDNVVASVEAGVGTGQDIREALQNVNSATARIDASIAPLVKRVDAVLLSVQGAAGSIQTLGEDNRERVAALLDRLVAVMTDVGRVAEAIREGRGSVGALLADQDLYDTIKETLADLQRHPWKFIWKE
jgi:phospholipid/cholesterol/gamma-HCH transport system substrate-binding protein